MLRAPRSRWAVGPSVLAIVLGVPAPSFASQLAVGGNVACTTPGGAELVCWGSSAWLGERLAPGRTASAGGALAPATVQFQVRFDTLALADDTACGLSSRGVPLCLGATLSNPGSGDGTLVARRQKRFVGARGIAMSGSYGCVVTRSRSVSCFGKHADAAMRPVRKLHFAGALSLGDSHGCATTTGGRVFCFGPNAGASVSPDSEPRNDDAQLVHGVRGAISVAAASRSSCALVVGGQVLCWGRLSDATPSRPTPIAGLPALRAIVGPSSGGNHYCGLSALGAVYCWGAREDGVLGISSGVDVPPSTLNTSIDPGVKYAAHPIHVAGLPPATEVATGRSASCARTTTGDVWCWGDPWVASVGAKTWPKKRKGRLAEAPPRLVYAG